jgi:hypothetical protein
MRYFLILGFLMFISCNISENKEKDSVVIEKDSVVDIRPKYGTPEYVLEHDGEKVVLISKIVKLDPIKVAEIISVYEDSIDGIEPHLEINDAIRSLSKNSQVSEKVISIIIFMYKYDTLIKEDYEDEIIDEFTENANQNAVNDYEVNTGR